MCVLCYVCVVLCVCEYAGSVLRAKVIQLSGEIGCASCVDSEIEDLQQEKSNEVRLDLHDCCMHALALL